MAQNMKANSDKEMIDHHRRRSSVMSKKIAFDNTESLCKDYSALAHRGTGLESRNYRRIAAIKRFFYAHRSAPSYGGWTGQPQGWLVPVAGIPTPFSPPPLFGIYEGGVTTCLQESNMNTKTNGAIAPTVFNFKESNQLRTIDINGEPWFIASDVISVLTLDRKALERLDDDEKGVSSIHTPGGQQEMTTINESGLYSLILGSRKPEAKPFKRWVTHEVLPSIRKTGQYGLKALPEPKTKKALPGCLSLEQQDVIKSIVRERSGELPQARRGAAAITMWSSVKSKFGYKCYKENPPENFTAICSLLARLPLEGELLPKPQENGLPSTRAELVALIKQTINDHTNAKHPDGASPFAEILPDGRAIVRCAFKVDDLKYVMSQVGYAVGKLS